jgi:hypothetical protein
MSDKSIDKDLTVAGGNYHGLDYPLFHMSLRKNAIERASAYMGQTPEREAIGPAVPVH